MLSALQFFVCPPPLFFFTPPQTNPQPHPKHSQRSEPFGNFFPPPLPLFLRSVPLPAPRAVSAPSPEQAGLGKFSPSSGAGWEHAVLGTAAGEAVKHPQQRDRSRGSGERGGRQRPSFPQRARRGAAPASRVPHTGVRQLRRASLFPTYRVNPETFPPPHFNPRGGGVSWPSPHTYPSPPPPPSRV